MMSPRNDASARPSEDGTRVVYSWLPHSTAPSASSTVSIRVRSAYLPDADGGGGDDGGRYYLRRRRRGRGRGGIRDDDVEEKFNEGGGMPSSSSSSSYSRECDRPECLVEASVYGMGLPLQSCPVSTRYSPLLPDRCDDDDDDDDEDDVGGGYCHRDHAPDDDDDPTTNGDEGGPSSYSSSYSSSSGTTAIFDSILRLPAGWRDLTRDACVAFDVRCVSPCGDDEDDWDHHRASSSSSSSSSSSGMTRVWGTTLPLFDERGRMRSGIVKLRLHPGMRAYTSLDGSAYNSSD